MVLKHLGLAALTVWTWVAQSQTHSQRVVGLIEHDSEEPKDTLGLGRSPHVQRSFSEVRQEFGRSVRLSA